MLVAPAYPGSSREDSAASKRARQLKISCWTVDQLARIIESAESRRLTARHVLNIVLNYFSPEDVATEVNKVLEEPSWDDLELYQAILKALKQLEYRLPGRPRNVDMVATEVSGISKFSSLKGEIIEKAIRDLAGASLGGMNLSDQNIYVHVSHEELERRLNSMTKQSTTPRKLSNFRNYE